MRSESLGDGLDENRAFPPTDLFHDRLHALVESGHVVGIQPHAFEPVACSTRGKILSSGVARNWRVFADLVVLTQKDHRELPDPSEIHGFVNRADTGRAVAEIDDGDAIFGA